MSALDPSIDTLGLDLSVHGLPCRGGCTAVFHDPAASTDPAAFRRVCRMRLFHETTVHAYTHKPLAVAKPGFNCGPSHRRIFEAE